jgi:Tfp pilus assembly protein PilF
MKTNKNNGVLNAAWLKWAVIPLLTFLLAGFVARKLVPVKRGADGEQFKQTMAASLKKLDSGDRAGAVEGLVRAGKMAPGDVAGQKSLISKFTALGEHKLAAEAIERSLRAAPKERQMVRNYAGLCEFLLDHGDLDNAKRILAGDLMPRWPDALETAYVQGVVALKSATGKDGIEAAAKQFEKCLAVDPGHVPSRV